MSVAPGGAGNPLDVLTIVSNLFFILSAITAWMGEIWILVMLYGLIIINSSMYHACNSFASMCVFPSLTHRMMDFFFAQLTIPATMFTLILIPRSERKVQTMGFIAIAFAVFILQIAVGESIYIQIAIAVGAIGGILLYWAIYAAHAARTTGRFALPPYEWGHLIMGVILTATACALYATEMQYHLLYWAVHSAWHGVAAMGQVFVILARPEDTKHEYTLLNVNIVEPRMLNRRYVHTTPRSRVQ